MEHKPVSFIRDLVNYQNGDKLRLLRWQITRMTPSRFYVEDGSGDTNSMRLLGYTEEEFLRHDPGSSNTIYNITLDVTYEVEPLHWPHMMGTSRSLRWIDPWQSNGCTCGAIHTSFASLHLPYCINYTDPYGRDKPKGEEE